MSFADYDRFVLDVDARSRIAVYMANHADSPLIAQLGNLSHDAFRGGFFSGDGCMAVSGDASSIQMLPASQAFYPTAIPQSVCTSLVPSQTSMPMTVSAPQALSYPVPASQSSNALMLPQIKSLRAHELPDVLEQNDYIFLCDRLGLDKIDFDNFNTGIFIRTFFENKIPTPPGWIRLPVYDHLGSFLRMNVLFNGSVFELKVFKYFDRDDLYPLRFKPEHSGVWFPDVIQSGKTIVLDPDVNAVWNRTSPGNAGLIDAGDIAGIDYKIFHGHPVQLVWRSDTHQSQKRFAGALSFLAEAKKHGVDVSILKCSGSSRTNEILDLLATIKQARCYGLDIPAVLKETGYVHVSTPQEEFIPDDIPFFWSRGGSTLFFSPGYKAMLKKLLTVFCRKPQDTQGTVKPLPNPEKATMRSGIFPRKQVGIFYPTTAEARTNKLLGKKALGIPCISSESLQKKDGLIDVLYQYKIEALFIVYADELSVKELTIVLDLCECLRIVTGVFSPVAAEDKPAPEDVLKGTTMELVAQYYFVTADGDSVIAKDMITEITERYTFEKDGTVSVSEVKNTEMAEAEEE